MGPNQVPVGYPVVSDLAGSLGTAASVRFNGNPAYVLDQSSQAACQGDDPGSGKGVKSGTVNGEVKPTKGSGSVRIGGKAVIRDGDPCSMQGGNCEGIYVVQPAPSGTIEGGRTGASASPPLGPETPEESRYFRQWLDQARGRVRQAARQPWDGPAGFGAGLLPEAAATAGLPAQILIGLGGEGLARGGRRLGE
jgi:hypothetical protein